MFWLGFSILLSAIFICCTLIFIHLADRAYSNAIGCLDDLCDTLNDKFPGSDLKVITDKGSIKVRGELKYIKNK